MLPVIWHLVPGFPPQINGLGDYAAILSSECESMGFATSRFIVCNPNWLGHDPRVIVAATAEELSMTLSKNDIGNLLVHFVNYGYAKRGCPVWMPRILRHWRTGQRHRRLVVFMHEIYAFDGRPWKSAFWLSPLQRWIARGMHRISDHVFTSNQNYAQWLGSNASLPPISVLPVISNVGEASCPPAAENRDGIIVLFGSWGTRMTSLAAVLAARRRHSIKVLEIGPGASVRPIGIEVPPWKFTGILPPDVISKALLNARYCAIAVGSASLAKSGTFAAAAAHACLPVVSRKPESDKDGIASAWLWNAVNEENAKLGAGEALHRWYQGHRAQVCARVISNAFLGMKNI